MDLAIGGVALVQHHGEAGILDDLVGRRSHLDQRRALGEAVHEGGDAAEGGSPLLKRGGCLGPDRLVAGLEIGKDVDEILRERFLPRPVGTVGDQTITKLGGRGFRGPETGEVRLPVAARAAWVR